MIIDTLYFACQALFTERAGLPVDLIPEPAAFAFGIDDNALDDQAQHLFTISRGGRLDLP